MAKCPGGHLIFRFVEQIRTCRVRLRRESMIRQTKHERCAHAKECFCKADRGAQTAVEIVRQTRLMDELVQRGGALLSVPFGHLV